MGLRRVTNPLQTNNILIQRQEFVCFSYDEDHTLHLDDSSLKYYYTPQIGADLSKGFQTFEKLDDSADEHLDSLLKAVIAHEKETGKKIDANVVTWRGMMTKVTLLPPLRDLIVETNWYTDHGHPL